MGFVRDSVSVNGSALEKVKGAHYTACDILCFSHMLNNTGDRMSFPRVSNFMGAWLQLSTAANKIWKGLTGQSMGGGVLRDSLVVQGRTDEGTCACTHAVA